MRAYSLGLYEKAMPDELGWEEKLSCARACGYDYLEISIDESEPRLARLDWSAAERQAVCRAVERTGLPIRSMCLSGHRRYPLGSGDEAVRARSLEIMEKAIELADALGVRTIQLAGYDVYYEESSVESKRRFAENLRRAARLAEKYGVLLGFETMETPFMNTVWKSRFFVDLVDSPYLGIYPDAGNLNNAAESGRADVLADLASGRGRLLAMHLKPTMPGKFRDMYFDDPDQRVDFEAVIAQAWALGVRRYVTELWHLGRPDWRKNVETASRFARDILDRQEAE